MLKNYTGGSAFGRKPHTDSRSKNKYKNGKSPFPPKVPPEVPPEVDSPRAKDSPQAKDLPRAEELAGVSIKRLDWVGFALKNRPS